MIIKPQPEYELIDSGDEMKLERYGKIVLARPDPQAIWPKRLGMKEWDMADATFVKASKGRAADERDASSSAEEKGKWVIRKNGALSAPESKWPIALGPVRIFARLTPFKHTGIFPEQLANWQWADEILQKHISSKPEKKPRVLNLFGYSGGASVACARAGAEVTHVDASRSAISWAKENMIETGLNESSIRWILEDAVMFVKREIRRGNRYEGIIMDPPVFGRGAKGEVWKIERDLRPLLELCYKLLSDKPLFFILNGYASGYSSVSYANNLAELTERFGGQVENGELLIEESATDSGKSPESASAHISGTGSGQASGAVIPRYMPCGIVARWRAQK